MFKKMKNNNGSTLVLLVMTVAVISLLGTSILGVTMMNYKIKKTNSDMKYSFYMSESGLDRAYAEAYSVVLEAVSEANNAAKNKINEFDIVKLTELSLSPDLYSDIIEDYDGDGVYEYKQDAIKALSKKVFEEKYIDIVKQDMYKALMGVDPDGSVSNGILVDDEEEKLKLYVIKKTFDDFDMDTPMELSISSEYTKKKEGIIRTTDVDLIVEVPDYNESYTVETVNLELNPFWSKVMTAENINIDKQGETIFNGEVFINNNLNLEGSGTVLFMQDLAVKSNISIFGDKEMISGNVYTSNILMNGENAKFTATTKNDNTVDYEGVVVQDDLEMNAAGQEITINGSYYGFGYGGGAKDNTLNSSIIINNNNIKGITINKGNFDRGNLYLLGTSYIKGISPYATGESLSVRGNYVAYTKALNYTEGGAAGKYDFGNVIFNYDDYLPYFPQLVEWFVGESGVKTEITAYEKAEYIKKYQQLGGSSLELLGGKIKINNSDVYTLGAYINGESIITSHAPLEDWPALKAGIGKTFNTKVKKLGYEHSSNGNDEYSINEIFDNIPLNFNTEIMNGSELLYVNKVSRTYGDNKKYSLGSDVKSGLIITNEDVEISGTVDFTGVIICAGDINILDDGADKTFNYNKGVVSKIIAENGLQEVVFKNTTNVGSVSITTFGSGNDEVNVDFNPLLKFSNWKIK
ncbi:MULTISPECIES: hypothetical protein [unclassified Sedimentibacter]|uniref:hypothetical protein n=1 Tax=unclassified Sedimentibacter TaxID=2649220 RepID=UPI0027E09A08|nr:hypothetical protein [Sedimentibacter sp. MB35-C1]WMJ76669.1 hypothetical protein RBQ61_13905 [Sedimentibacter sp. MB35-C1]